MLNRQLTHWPYSLVPGVMLALSTDFGLCLNPHLLTRPDRADPAVGFGGVSGGVFGPLLSQGDWGLVQAVLSRD